MDKNKKYGPRINRRDLLKWGGAVLVGSGANLTPRPVFSDDTQTAPPCEVPEVVFEPCSGGDAIEVYPTSPLIGGYVDGAGVVRGSVFTDPLIVPPALRPVPISAFGSNPAGPAIGRQSSLGTTHQIWTSDLRLPDPICYRIQLLVRQHYFTSLKALPIDATGNPTIPPRSTNWNPRYLPGSTIYGFNGTFPGPMINALYGYPVLVRFENHLNENPFNLDRNDFGDPLYRFLTHLHNGHTAPESDGNPHATPTGFRPGQYTDNLYLNYPAGNDDREKQAFLWFHDHYEGHTGANVYKGLVGLYPIYDPKLDPGNENVTSNPYNLRLPGVRTDNGDGSFDVAYDIPLAFYDCRLDDGVTQHKDFHNGCGETHPEWWGQTYFRHFPDHGFVGDIFTVNGKAYPVLEVKRRKYRFRLLDASIARAYKFVLMSSTGGPKVAPGVQGQYQLPDGQQSMRFTQIASEGGLLPFPIVRDSFELWPSRRKEVVIDFTRYMDGSPTTKGDEVYLVDILEMPDGRKPDDSSGYRVPVLKFVIGDLAADNSRVPDKLRDLPPIDFTTIDSLPHKSFELQRGGGLDNFFADPVSQTLAREFEWSINDRPFNVCTPLAFPQRGKPEVWTVKNGGGGWIHPMHFHQEEHRIIRKNGVDITAVRPFGPDDAFAKEDTISLGPGEEVVIYRNFRTFIGNYVAHCHNLAHEDHSMMFGWKLVDPNATT